MSITTVLMNFRTALESLVPCMDRAGIPWKRPDAYDEWDDVASTLYQVLVVETIRWSLPESEQIEFKVQAYDLLAQAYSGRCTIEVSHSSLAPGRWLFHSFQTESKPFDYVEVRLISSDGRPLSDCLERCPAEGSIFQLRMLSGVILK